MISKKANLFLAINLRGAKNWYRNSIL